MDKMMQIPISFYLTDVMMSYDSSYLAFFHYENCWVCIFPAQSVDEILLAAFHQHVQNTDQSEPSQKYNYYLYLTRKCFSGCGYVFIFHLSLSAAVFLTHFDVILKWIRQDLWHPAGGAAELWACLSYSFSVDYWTATCLCGDMSVKMRIWSFHGPRKQLNSLTPNFPQRSRYLTLVDSFCWCNYFNQL